MFTRRDRVIREFLRYRLVVTMHDGGTWEGVVCDVDARTVVLNQAEAIQPDKTRVSADGDVLLPRDDIAYMQHVPALQRS